MPLNVPDFDASQFKPQYTMGGHPKGRFPATISNTELRETKDKTGGMFVVEYTTPAGKIEDRFNLWNTSPQAVQIAQNQLSALCYVTGIFRIQFSNDGAALRGAKLQIEVDDQKNKAGEATGYVEVSKIFDMQGNEPGKSGGAPQTQQQPQGQQGGGWGGQQSQPNPNPSGGAPQGWQQPSNQPTQQQANTAGAPQGQAWQPGPNTSGAAPAPNTNAPPWAR